MPAGLGFRSSNNCVQNTGCYAKCNIIRDVGKLYTAAISNFSLSMSLAAIQPFARTGTRRASFRISRMIFDRGGATPGLPVPPPRSFTINLQPFRPLFRRRRVPDKQKPRQPLAAEAASLLCFWAGCVLRGTHAAVFFQLAGATCFSASNCCNSPASNISIMISLPPTNSPFT